MAKRIDPNSLTIDAKKILEKASIQDRRDILANPAAQSFLAKLTPTEYAKLFPFARQLPDIGKAMSGGTTTAPGGGTISPPGGGAAPSATPTPSGKGAVPSAPQYVKPQASSNAQQNSFLEFLNRMNVQQTTKVASGPLISDEKGYVNPNQLRSYIINKVQNSSLVGYVPPDGEKYGITKGTAQEWANYLTGLAKHESDLKTSTHGDIGSFGGHGSRGLFQLSPQDALTYRIQNSPFSYEQLQDPSLNTDVAIKIHEYWLREKGKGIFNGPGRYWGPISLEGWTPGKGRDKSLPWSDWRKQELDKASQVPQHQQPGGTQSSAPTGLRPEVGTTKPEEPPQFKYSRDYVKDQAKGLSQEVISKLSALQKLHGDFTITSTTGGVQGPGTGHSRGSPHYVGSAVDIRIKDSSNNLLPQEELMRLVENARKAGFNRIGLAGDHLHLDMRPGSFTVFDEGGGKSAFGISSSDLQTRLEQIIPESSTSQVPSATTQTDIKKPAEYDSWNPTLKKYIENLPPSVQQQIFQKAEELKQNGQDINTYFDTYAKTNNVPMQAAAQATATAIIDSPPGELPPVNPEGFGVGVIHGQRMTKEAMKQEAQREDYTTGKIKFTGFDDKDLSAAEFQAGSGNRRGEGFPSIPSGTFSLSPQKTGPVISNYLSRHGISPTGAFGQVYNVGLPQSPTSTGYDPKTGRSREQIQIHSNVSRDINKLVSSGCLTVSPEEYPRLVENIERARKASKSGISLVVQNNPDGTSSFTIMPSARATNPITVNTAVKNFQQTGNISGVQTQPPQQQTGTPPTEVLQHNQPVGTQSSAPTGLRSEVTPTAPTPSPTMAATPAPVQQAPAPTMAAPPAPVQQAPTATPAPVQQAPAPTMAAPPASAPVSEAPPPQENQVKPNAVGGQEQTTENIGFYDTNTGKTLGTVSRGEVVAVNQSGVADIKPEPRIGEIPQMRQDYQQNNPEPPKSAIAENSASMRNEATPMPQPTSIVATSQGLFGGISQSSSPDNFFISESYKRAMAAYNRFQTTDRKINPGFDTLFG